MVLFQKTCIIVCLLLACATGCTEADIDRWNQSTQWMRTGAAGSGETWTIECNAYEGPGHKKMAIRMAKLLGAVPELSGDRIRVEHDTGESRVYYGRYKLHYVEAKVEKSSGARGDMIVELNDEIKKDLRFIKQLSLGSDYPFFSARVMQENPPDVGPHEWDLRNASGVYTLNVGVTYSTRTMKKYKQAAIEWVRDLRNRGYEAYYYHDPDKPQTSICVGSFGEEAVRIQKWVEPNGEARVRRTYTPDVVSLQQKEEFRFNLENGAKVFRSSRDPKTGAMARMPNKSFLVKIPNNDEASD